MPDQAALPLEIQPCSDSNSYLHRAYQSQPRWYRDRYTLAQVLADPLLSTPLRNEAEALERKGRQS